ncbi:hypothetical protein DKT77_18940 [Meridianimarinicoccus roseus]|uniref:Uncharacterized protein n=1 Tax=Meridianimarinicoccus roseus TaxID=2072018 RepID=A0A2V2L6H5_9RHOB|nr:hypothetical protein DKT77_18940 [Meridianimarinicoccus roseus]
MTVWQFFLRTEPTAPATRRGYVRAECETTARQLVKRPDAILIDIPHSGWPGSPDAQVLWPN